MIPSGRIDDDVWDNKEFDWNGKSFYYIKFLSLFSNPIGLPGKLEQLVQEARKGGFKVVGNMVLVEHSSFGGEAMIEVEKLDKFDADVHNFEERTTVCTVVYRGSPGKLHQGIKRLREIVTQRKGMEPRKIFYAYNSASTSGSYKTVLFALT
jgi:hypothetical protein